MQCGRDTGGKANCPQHPRAIVRDVLPNGTTLTGIADNYEITKCLSLKGGTAVTYMAKNTAGNLVVIKQLVNDPDPVIHKDNEVRFEREAIFLKTLKSNYLPAGLDRFDVSGHKYFVQECIDGQDLSDYIKANGGPIAADDALEIGIKCAEALGLLHDFVSPTSGVADAILHRDIKPDNIILRTGTLEPVLIDFGSAVMTQSVLVGQTTMIPGTPGYISQSRINGVENATDDLFSLAYTIIFLVTGDEPQDNNKNRDNLLKKIPSAWKQNFEFATQDTSLPGRANAQISLRPKSWKIFQNQLIGLLSPSRQVQYGINPQPVQPTTPQPVQPIIDIYTIDFQSSNSYMTDPHTYARNIQGRVFLNGQPAQGLTVTPMISDIGGKSAANGPGKSITTGILGEFVLDYSDCEVPISVSQRDIELILTDSTGNQLHTDQITIFKPRSAGVSAAKASFWEAMKAPFAAISAWRLNRAAIKSATAQANLQNNTNLLQAQNRLASAKANAKSAKLTAKQKAKQQIAQQKLAAKQAPGYVSPGTHIWNIVRVIVPLALLIIAVYFLYSPVWDFLVHIEWNIWGWRIAISIASIIIVYLLFKLVPAIYRLGKRKNWGTVIKGWFSSLLGLIQISPIVVRIFIITVLLFVMLFGATIHQAWLILMSMALILLVFGFKPGYIMYIRLILAFFLGGIAIITWL